MATQTQKIPQFFKIYDAIKYANQLHIPSAYISHMRGNTPKRSFLKDCFGNMWPVELTKTGNEWYFQEGWAKVAQDNSLEHEDFLVFQFDGEKVFHFKLIGRNSCEKKGVGALKFSSEDMEIEKHGEREQTKSDLSGKGQEGPAANATEERAVTNTDKEMETNAEKEMASNTEKELASNTEVERAACNAGKESVAANADASEERAIIKTGKEMAANAAGEESAADNGEKEIVVSNAGKERSTDKTVEEGATANAVDERATANAVDERATANDAEERATGNSVAERPIANAEETTADNALIISAREEKAVINAVMERALVNVVVTGEERAANVFHTGEERAAANVRQERAAANPGKGIASSIPQKKTKAHIDLYGLQIIKSGLLAQPKNPYFVTKIRRNRRQELYIPVEVIKDFRLNLPQKVILRDPSGRTWLSDLTTWKDGRAFYIGGWDSLCRVNLIEEEDKCVCEFVQGQGEPTVQIQIIRSQDLNLLQLKN